MGNTALSSADKLRLKQHFDCIRDVEITMGTMGAACTKAGLSTTQLDALKSGIAFKTNGMIEDVVKLHMEVVALAFACNYNRVASLQWGDGTDGTKYTVPSNASLGWTFHQLLTSHSVGRRDRQRSDRRGGAPRGRQAADVDAALRSGSVQGPRPPGQGDGRLADAYLRRPEPQRRNVPHIIWGNGGGYLKQGQYIDAGGSITNNKLFNTLITAAIRDKSTAAVNFGMGTGTARSPG